MPNKNYIAGKEVICKNCETPFTNKHYKTQVFCSHSCASKFNWKKPKEKSQATCHPDKPLAGKGQCKSCYYKKYWKDNPIKKETSRMKNRRTMLMKQYSITPAQWNKMFKRQKGICPICIKPIQGYNNKQGKAAANVDHDHKTGRVRGLLCWKCNKMRIGNNTAEVVRRMLDYLESDFDGRFV